MEIEKGFRKLIDESGFVEKEEFYDKFRKMVFKPTVGVTLTPPHLAVAFGIVQSFMIIPHESRGCLNCVVWGFEFRLIMSS